MFSQVTLSLGASVGGNFGRHEDHVADPGQINLPTCGIQLGLPHIALSGKVTQSLAPGKCSQLPAAQHGDL